MPKFEVVDQLNHEGRMLGPGEPVDLPLNVAGDPAVRGHLKPLDEEAKLAMTVLPGDAGVGLQGNVFRAGAPLALHELDQQDNQLHAEKAMFEKRLAAIDGMLKANSERRRTLQQQGQQAQQQPRPGAPAGPSAAPANVQGTTTAPVVGGAANPVPQPPPNTAAQPMQDDQARPLRGEEIKGESKGQ
jgi:hypothetical protein